MKKTNWNTDRIIGLSVMMISLLTLIIFIYQTNIMRAQSRLSVTPLLSFNQAESISDSTYRIKCSIKNKGLGPAIVESVTIIYEGERIKVRFADFFDTYFGKFTQYANLESETHLSKGTTLSAGEEVNFFTVSVSRSVLQEFMDYAGFDDNNPPFDIEVLYSSIYEEEWKVTLKGEGREEL